MELSLNRVTSSDKEVFENLFQFFGYDFSEMNGMDVSEDGQYHDLKDISDYYTEADYISYLIMVDNKYAGLAVIRVIEDNKANYLRHFFIMRKYRRLKVGQNAVFRIFDNYPGKWIVKQFDFNTPAINFWRNVISRYTNGDFVEVRRDDDKGPQQEFFTK